MPGPHNADLRGNWIGTWIRPKHASLVRVDLVRSRANVQEVDRAWSVLRIMHTFSGSRYTTPGMYRDWILTSMWVVAMDAFAAGLLVMICGSYYMWWRLKRKRRLGWMVLAARWCSCALFLIGLASRG